MLQPEGGRLVRQLPALSLGGLTLGSPLSSYWPALGSFFAGMSAGKADRSRVDGEGQTERLAV